MDVSQGSYSFATPICLLYIYGLDIYPKFSGEQVHLQKKKLRKLLKQPKNHVQIAHLSFGMNHCRWFL